ncbi:MAG: hypothetical protein LBQ75_02360 [Zoogloeaceae bacterium]|jgi:hypothetical protein|nr:hypothetical protein [Zoogloeaceae bacterium]
MTVSALGEVRMTLCVRVALISLLAVVMGGYGQATEKQAKNKKDSVCHENSVCHEESCESACWIPWFMTDVVKKSDWKGVKCNARQEEEGYVNIQVCTFPNANLQQVYGILKRKDTDLKPRLPASNIKYGDFEKPPVVTYTYKTPKHLYIRLETEGGAGIVEIIEEEGKTRSILRNYAD